MIATPLNQRLRSHWKAQDALPNFGLNENQVLSFEAKHHVLVPSDLRAFLIEFNGTSDMCNRDLFRFLPLSEYQQSSLSPMRFGEAFMKSHPNDFREFFVFADFLQWCYGYAVRLGGASGQNEVVLIGGLSAPVVASPFPNL